MSDWKTPNSDALDIKKDEPNEQGEYPVYIGTYEEAISFPSAFDAGKLSYVYKFINTNGEPFSAYGFTTFNRYMEAIPKGSMVRFSYAGMGTTKKGKPVHKCKVQYKAAEQQVSGGVSVEDSDDLPF